MLSPQFALEIISSAGSSDIKPKIFMDHLSCFPDVSLTHHRKEEENGRKSWKIPRPSRV